MQSDEIRQLNPRYSLQTIVYKYYQNDWNGTPNENELIEYRWVVVSKEIELGYSSFYFPKDVLFTSFFAVIIMIMISVSNMLLSIAIATEKSRKATKNKFTASLVLSDFLLGLIIMPFSLANILMGHWIFGPLWCHIHMALVMFLTAVSVNSLCLLSLDKYWSVTHNVKYHRKWNSGHSIAMICAIWVISAIISAPPLIAWKKNDTQICYPLCLVIDNIRCMFYSAFGYFQVSAFVITFIYYQIYAVGLSRMKQHIKLKQKNLPERGFSSCSTTTNFAITTTFTRFEIKIPSLIDTSPSLILQSPQLEKIIMDGTTKNVFSTDPIEKNFYHKCEKCCNTFVIKTHTKHFLLPKRLTYPKTSSESVLALIVSGKYGKSVNGSKGKKNCEELKFMPFNRPIKLNQKLDLLNRRRFFTKAKKRHTNVILGMMMTSFILSWLSFLMLYILKIFCIVCDIEDVGYMVSFWAGYCKSILNPFIYIIFNKNRRNFLKAFFM